MAQNEGAKGTAKLISILVGQIFQATARLGVTSRVYPSMQTCRNGHFLGSRYHCLGFCVCRALVSPQPQIIAQSCVLLAAGLYHTFLLKMVKVKPGAGRTPCIKPKKISESACILWILLSPHIHPPRAA